MSGARLFVAIPLLALAALGSAQTITLRYKPALKSVTRYSMVTKMTRSLPNNTQQGMVQTVPVTMTIVSRVGTDTTVENKTGKATVTPIGMKQDMSMMTDRLSNKTTRSVIDQFAKPKVAAGSESGIQSVSYPVKPIKVGETWTVTMDMDRFTKMMPGVTVNGSVPMKYTLLSVKREGGKSVATIDVNANGNVALSAQGQNMKLGMKGLGKLKIDVSNGMVVSSSMVMDVTIGLAGQSMKQHIDVTMKAL